MGRRETTHRDEQRKGTYDICLVKQWHISSQIKNEKKQWHETKERKRKKKISTLVYFQ